MILVITGGTGSLGRAILDQQETLRQMGIKKIRVLSRDEHKQINLQKNYKGSIQLDCFLADVTDEKRMRFGLKDAHYVIHAAAQKHIDKFALDVPTGLKTNILGSQNVSEAFLEQKNAESGLLVSTDKAAEPLTAYGTSKLTAEHLWLWHNTYQKEVKMGVTRYGNVFGSKGSVIETWTKQAQESIPLTLTDKECTRFFVTLEDAALFVLKHLKKNPAKTVVPEMKGCEMMRLARIIWAHWSKDLFQYRLSGMRGLEKIHEVLEIGGLNSSQVDQFKDDELKKMYGGWLDAQNKNHR